MSGFVWNIIEVIANLAEIYLLWVFIEIFNEKLPNSHKGTFIIIQTFVLTILNIFLPVASIITMFIIILFTFVILIYYYGIEKWKQHFFIICLFYIIATISELILVIVIMLIFKKEPNNIFNQTDSRLIAIIICKLLTFFIIKNINYRRLKRGIQKKINIYKLAIVFFLNLTITYIIYDLYRKININDVKNFYNIIIVSIIIIIIDVIIFNISNILASLLEKEIEYNLQTNHYLEQKKQIEQLNELLIEVKRKQHDYNNNLSTIYAMMSKVEHKTIEKYLCELIEETAITTEIISKHNSIISVITNYKLQKAKSKDIKLQTNINIPDDLIVDEKDIATILGNILDNAIEACEKLDEDKRYIVINIGVNKGYLNIYVENSSVGNYNKIGDKFITTKATNIRSHGIGLSNVRYIVERNDGIININAEDDRFTIKISIIF